MIFLFRNPNLGTNDSCLKVLGWLKISVIGCHQEEKFSAFGTHHECCRW